ESTMTQQPPESELSDEFFGYGVKLLINNVVVGHFTELHGVGVGVDYLTYRDHPHQLTNSRLPVTLSFGITTSKDLWEWLVASVAREALRRDVSIVMLDPTGRTEDLRWNIINAWPEGWFAPGLDMMNDMSVIGGLPIEKLILGHEGVQRVDG